MLKKLALLAAVLLLAALPAAAKSPCNTGSDLSWLFAPASEPVPTAPGDNLDWLFAQTVQPAVTANPAAPATIELASTRRKPNSGKPGFFKIVTCSEDCDELPDISCTGNVCNAVSRNCSLGGCERGQVTCDGVTTFCSQACPPNCTVFQCRQGCRQPGCFAVCLDTCTCECDTICQ